MNIWDEADCMKNTDKKISPAVKKYLEKYGTDGWNIIREGNSNYEMVIVIPALKEFENIKKLLVSLTQNDSSHFEKVVIVFVVNSIENASQETIKDNAKSIELLKKIIFSEKGNDEVIDIVKNSGLNIGLVDASSKGKQLPIKDGGVGLARKIGMDLSLKFFDYKQTSQKILVCLDADCTVKENYITEIYNYFKDEKCSAAYVKYEHPIEGDAESKLAIVCYEIFLRYYVLGLKIARSPFSIHTIGSTMVCDVESYINIQGMNKKKAAEDFYFMEKLAKIRKIHEIDSTTIFPSSRGSWRVPFGTGQRVNRYLSKKQNEYLLYSPKSFYLLRDWLSIFLSHEILSADEYLEEANKINPELYNFLIQNSFRENWNRIVNNSRSKEQINNQKSFWFDGFRTLKLIHHLRDTVFPQTNMFVVLDEIFEYLKAASVRRNLSSEIPCLESQIKYLGKLRELV